MKKLFICFLLVLCMFLSLYGKKKTPLTFRKTRWGMSQVEVKATEKQKPIKEKKGELTYLSNVAGLDCFIVYDFIQNKLVESRYLSRVTHLVSNEYILDYLKLKKLLIKKYKKPIEDVELWTSAVLRCDYRDYGAAIHKGYLTLRADWKNKYTTISIILGGGGENYGPCLGIVYKSVVLKDLKEKEKEEEVKDL